MTNQTVNVSGRPVPPIMQVRVKLAKWFLKNRGREKLTMMRRDLVIRFPRSATQITITLL